MSTREPLREESAIRRRDFLGGGWLHSSRRCEPVNRLAANRGAMPAIIVHARPERLAEVEQAIVTQGLSVAARDPIGRLVVAPPAADASAIGAALSARRRPAGRVDGGPDASLPNLGGARMNICGVLVHVAPDRVAEVAAALDRIPGSELHGRVEGGRLIVTLEDTATASAADGLAAIHALPGVVAAALVYHHFEPERRDVAGQAAPKLMEA